MAPRYCSPERTGQHRHRPHGPVDVDALLIRPDGCVAWALPFGQDLGRHRAGACAGPWVGHPA
ncbi:aromatic-ring hydroxylase C-terminal domain-containing protein [Phytohabitans suffuscus]|uniref:aromatic-ring hydroxylase C-terminal domain-containing protein n=1 Tax=Phytohabitans suffuscus TaxID=624315 RepID=UPI0038CD175C